MTLARPVTAAQTATELAAGPVPLTAALTATATDLGLYLDCLRNTVNCQREAIHTAFGAAPACAAAGPTPSPGADPGPPAHSTARRRRR
jgi:hypothetical protein